MNFIQDLNNLFIVICLFLFILFLILVFAVVRIESHLKLIANFLNKKKEDNNGSDSISN